MDLERADRLAAHKIGSDDQVVEDLTAAALHDLERLDLIHRGHSLVVALLIHVLELLHALLDLLAGLGQAIVCARRLRLHRERLHPEAVRIVHGRELHRVSAGSVEVDPQEGPLALEGVRDTLDSANVHRDPGRR